MTNLRKFTPDPARLEAATEKLAERGRRSCAYCGTPAASRRPAARLVGYALRRAAAENA